VNRHTRPFAATLLSVIATIALAACGSSSSSSSSAAASSASSSGAAKTGGTITLLMGGAPQSLDPAMDYTTQGAEMLWVTYTGLTTYTHAQGPGGAALIPGLATALPVISDGGKTYTATLRKGLVFSNGQPVKASDFTVALERAIKVPWGGSGQFMTPVVVGGTAYAAGKAKTISGVQTNDATGKIVIHLTAPYGPFDNVLAFPALGLVPAGTPLKNEPTNPPPGVGPFMTTNIVPNQGWESKINPYWAKMNIPGIPAAKVNVQVKLSTNVPSNALGVLNNTADVFDWADVVPGSLLPQIKAKAGDRFSQINMGGSTYYIFMNSTLKPFNNQLAREAVVTGLNQEAMNRLGSGTLDASCLFLPPDVPGYQASTSSTCPYGTPGTGNLAKAKQLVKQSGMAGTPVTVWSQGRTPRQQWMTYYTSFLNQIGFKATQKVIADATYFTTIGDLKLHPQTGFTDWNQDFPNPVDFYLLLSGKAILPTNNENPGEINDPYINSQIAKLSVVPTTQLGSVATQWRALDQYVAKHAYIAVFGYQTFPKFTSARINYSAALMQPIYGWDWTSLQLK
jgi:peptide/nickel transport system substrate-binding protein